MGKSGGCEGPHKFAVARREAASVVNDIKGSYREGAHCMTLLK
jgi:hypothetical protein